MCKHCRGRFSCGGIRLRSQPHYPGHLRSGGWHFSKQLYPQFWLDLTSSITFLIPSSTSQVERTDSNYGFQRRGNCISERLKALQRSHCSLGRGVCWGGLEEEDGNGGNGVDTKSWSPGSFCLFVCYIIFIYKQGSGDRERDAQWVRALTTKPGKTSSFSMEWVALWPPHTCPGNTCTHTQLINQSDFVFNLEGLCVDDFG